MSGVDHGVCPTVPNVQTFGLVVECWTNVQEVVTLRLDSVATFGVRSIGYVCMLKYGSQGCYNVVD